VHLLFLLQALYGQIVIPEAVASELNRGGQDDPRISQVLMLDWIETKPSTNHRLISELQTVYKLDKGESEAISLALELFICCGFSVMSLLSKESKHACPVELTKSV